MWKMKKTSHNDGGERGTHTSATDPCESGMNGECVHVSSTQYHQGIRTTQHIVSKPDRSNNGIDIFVRSKKRDLVFLADLIVELVLSALILLEVTQIRQLRRVLFFLQTPFGRAFYTCCFRNGKFDTKIQLLPAHLSPRKVRYKQQKRNIPQSQSWTSSRTKYGNQ